MAKNICLGGTRCRLTDQSSGFVVEGRQLTLGGCGARRPGVKAQFFPLQCVTFMGKIFLCSVVSCSVRGRWRWSLSQCYCED